MINTKELEKRWYKYKAKGLILIFSILMIISMLIYGGYYILYKLDLNIAKTTTQIENSKTIEKIDNEIKEENQTSTKKEIESPKEDVLLAPTIPIVDLEGEKRKDLQERKKVTRRKRVHSKERLVKAKTDNYITAKELSVMNSSNSIKKSREKKKINLNGTTSNYMSIMKNKFKQNKNPREALLIAKAYYRAGNYKNAEEWALKANNLDKKLDESWLVFAKSQDKLGKRKEALKVLVAYYRTSKSPKAKALIQKIKTESI